MIGRDVPSVVKAHPMFVGLAEDVVDDVAGCARNVAFRKGALLLAEGEPADTLYLLRRGRVAIEVHSPAGGPIVIETLGPGDAIGWSWLIPPFTWQFDARAIEPVGVVAVDGICLRAKADADPAFGYTLMQRVAAILVHRLQTTQLRLLDLYEASSAC